MFIAHVNECMHDVYICPFLLCESSSRASCMPEAGTRNDDVSYTYIAFVSNFCTLSRIYECILNCVSLLKQKLFLYLSLQFMCYYSIVSLYNYE